MSADFPFPACDRIGRERKKFYLDKKITVKTLFSLPLVKQIETSFLRLLAANFGCIFDGIFVHFFFKELSNRRCSRLEVLPEDPCDFQSFVAVTDVT